MRTAIHTKAIELIKEAFGEEIADLRMQPNVTDIAVNNDDSVWIMQAGAWINTGLLMSESAKLWAINSLGTLQNNRIIDHDAPVLETTIPDTGDRVLAVVPQTSVDGSSISIRIPSAREFGLEDFPAVERPRVVINEDTMELPAGRTDRKHAAIRWAIRNHVNFLLAGETNSAKTSLAKAITNEPDFWCDRIITIEDISEIRCALAPNKVRWLEGSVASGVLTKCALRASPQRLIYGEFRDGAACVQYVKGCNTGHRGSLSTTHANGPREAVLRILALLSEVPNYKPILSEVIEAIGLIIHMAKEGDVRGIVGIYRPVILPDGGFDVIEVA